MVNIGGDGSDPFYRYKRNTLEIKKVNKQRWVISNMDLVARQLKVKSSFIEKFYGEIKKRGHPMLGNGVFKGEINVADLEKILEQLIAAYILCPSAKCRLPEWNGEFCAACGETKGIKVKEVKKESSVCRHAAEATELIKELYAARENAAALGKPYDNFDKVIDFFWFIPTCEKIATDEGDKGFDIRYLSGPRRVSKEECLQKHEMFCKKFEEKFGAAPRSYCL